MLSTNSIFSLLCSLIVSADAINRCPVETGTFSDAQIYLFYAPQYSEKIKGQIVINYNNPNYQPGDVLILIENNTSTGDISFRRYTPTCSSGFVFTTIPTLNLNHDSISKFTTQLEGHCAYWERDDARSKQFCLSSHPQWMYDLRGYIGNRALQSLFLPGTHQSGSYSQVYPQKFVNKFVAAQDQDVLEQLIFGARYIDLRPSCVRGVYYNSHSFVLMWKMQKIVNHIKEFLDNTQEIVIVSFKEFCRGFKTYEDHVKFINYLQTEFEGRIFHKTDNLWNTTMNEIWNSKKRLIISYDHYITEHVNFMWPYIPQEWGDIPPGGDLLKFVTYTEQLQWKPKVTVAVYTIPSKTILISAVMYMFGYDVVSLHSLAVSIGPDITQSYNQLHRKSASVVAVDYIQATGIVDVAIEWNKRRSCMYSD